MLVLSGHFHYLLFSSASSLRLSDGPSVSGLFSALPTSLDCFVIVLNRNFSYSFPERNCSLKITTEQKLLI